MSVSLFLFIYAFKCSLRRLDCFGAPATPGQAVLWRRHLNLPNLILICLSLNSSFKNLFKSSLILLIRWGVFDESFVWVDRYIISIYIYYEIKVRSALGVINCTLTDYRACFLTSFAANAWLEDFEDCRMLATLFKKMLRLQVDEEGHERLGLEEFRKLVETDEFRSYLQTRGTLVERCCSRLR